MKRSEMPQNSSHRKHKQADFDKSQQARFQQACAKIQQSVSNHISQNLNDCESSEEEELEENQILQSVLNNYSEKCGNSDLQNTHQALIDSVKSGANVCLICIASIKRQESVWSCACCYSGFHLVCIQKWAKDSIYHQTSQLDDITSSEASSFQWCCPKCRNEYKQSQIPHEYRCYCNKVLNPTFDPWIVPHSCGNKCGKQLKPECGHTCLLLCHPGPCPPCPVTVSSTCYCSQHKPVVRRCSDQLWSCGKKCNKLLSCKHHYCSDTCHKDECLPCPKESLQSCICGSSTKMVSCSSPSWQCEKVCGKSLSCGAHKCEIVCHESSLCGNCPRSGLRSCPCGKSCAQLPCSEDIPPCGDTCSKLLNCNRHECSQRCHYGDCGNCLEVVMKQCRCGNKSKSLPCHKDYTCETKCKKMRDCKRHSCNKKCCLGQCPLCEQACNRMLGCRNHKCNSRCHSGPCYPCPLTVNVSCNCGKTVITVPCGREKVTKPPRCRKPCLIKPMCHHPFQAPHRCHFGDCPPCSQTCSINLPNCDHKCPAACHNAVLTKIEDKNHKRAGPWELQPAPVFKILKKPCPPCVAPIPVTCIGLHETSNFPCSEVRPYSCGKNCDRKLNCGNHSCSLECHVVLDSQSLDKCGSNCEECTKGCSKPRPSGCNHSCPKPCHSYECPPCKQMTRSRCHCSLVQLYIPCEKWVSSENDALLRNEVLSCKNQCPKELSCKHRCQKDCHSDSCMDVSECSKKIVVRCPCKRMKKETQCRYRYKPENKLDCDNTCQEKLEQSRKKLMETKEKDELVELQKAKEEFEYHQRRLEGKKRKPKKIKEIVETKSFIETKLLIGIISISTLFISIIVYYIIGS